MTSRGAEKMTQSTIGVDVSKDVLDVHRLADGARRRFANTAAGYKALIAWIGGEGARVIFEPTGPYHRAFERALANAGLSLVKVNPRQARRLAEATGQLAKTDRFDAALLARVGALLELPARPWVSSRRSCAVSYVSSFGAHRSDQRYSAAVATTGSLCGFESCFSLSLSLAASGLIRNQAA